MFRWYCDVDKCYVFLSDVSTRGFDAGYRGPESAWEPALQRSRWFTRGWTLQELIAPESVEFFSLEGERLGDKTSLELLLHEITGVPVEVLRGNPLAQYTVDERMLWVANRTTKRKEDEAYCLFGIFDIQMTLIYGEGKEKAFIRLKEEVNKHRKGKWPKLGVYAMLTTTLIPAWPKIPSSTVPFQRDLDFVGRQDILMALELNFSEQESHKRIALVGLGGVGKSQIAIEYSYRLRTYDPQTWVCWVHASTAERFEQGYKCIAAILELPGWNDPKTDILEVVWRWLSDVQSGRWFLILDNADDIDVFYLTPHKESEHRSRPLSSYIPQTVTGSVLITTRDRRAASWLSTGYASAIAVDIMTPEDAEKLLYTKIPDGLSSALERAELVHELGSLPLAITQAAAYISAQAKRMTVSKYLTLYRHDEANQSRLLGEESGDLRRDPGVPNSVIRTWQISFDQIKGKWPSAAELLSLMAMLDRQGIPEFLLSAGYTNSLDFEAALSPLNEFSLISIEKGATSFEMHRLVQLATRKWLEQYQEVERWQGKAIELVSKTFPDGNYSNWEMCEMLWPHTQEVLRPKLVLDANYLAKAVLLHHMAWYSLLQGRYFIAGAQSQESLSILEQLLEGNDIRIFDSVGLLGTVLQDQGKYDEAETMNRRALAGCETAFGPEHPNTLTSLFCLAALLEAQGNFEDATVSYQRALSGYNKILGPKHPTTIACSEQYSSLQEKLSAVM